MAAHFKCSVQLANIKGFAVYEEFLLKRKFINYLIGILKYLTEFSCWMCYNYQIIFF